MQERRSTRAAVARKVFAYLESHPEEQLTRSDIATKFGVAHTVVDDTLGPLVARGELERTRNDDDGLIWRYAGPPVQGSPHPFAAGARIAKATRAMKARETMQIDLTSIRIEKDVDYAPPERRGEQWKRLFDQMVDTGDSFAFPLEGKQALSRAASDYRKDNPSFRFSIRIVSKEQCRIWRKE